MLDLLKVLTILVGALFGALGLLTNYKDSNGKVTRWGRFALCGILLSAVLSFALQRVELAKIRRDAAHAEAVSKATEMLLQDIYVRAKESESQLQSTVASTSFVAQEIQETAKAMQESLRQQQRVVVTQNEMLDREADRRREDAWGRLPINELTFGILLDSAKLQHDIDAGRDTSPITLADLSQLKDKKAGKCFRFSKRYP